MTTKKKRTQRRKKRTEQRQTALQDMEFRSFGVRASTVNEESRTVEADISTETPVREFDWKRYEYVNRVLLADGVELPASRQVPLLDNHNRNSTQDQIGSIRNLRIEDGRVRGDLHFSSTAVESFTKVREGHITDVSAGFEVMAETYIEDGETVTINGRSFTGPVNVATNWRMREGSITPIGADEQAKLRGLQSQNNDLPEEREFEMNEELRKLCVERGMDAKLNDEQAQEWMLENKTRLFASEKPESKPERKIGGDGAGLGKEDLSDASILRAFEEFDKRREEKRKAFKKEVESLCELAGVEFDRSYCDADSIEEARTLIVDAKSKRQENLSGSFIRFADEQPADRGRHAIGTALSLRALNDTGARQESIDKALPQESRSKDADKYKHASLYELARMSVEMDGYDTRSLTKDQVAQIALGFADQIGVTRSGAAYHTTGSFAKLTQDAMNKSMMLGYTETPSTWRGPMRQASSVSDFKTIHRMRLGAIPNLPVWVDNKDPEKASMSDAEETYAVECRSLEISFSYKLLVNDDMDALSRTPFQMGTAASRTVNSVAWAQITSNPTLSDGVSLFSAVSGARKRANLTTGSISDYTAAINAMTTKMMQMRGENTPEGAESEDILSLQPAYIVAPASLRQTVLQLVRSAADPNATHAGVANINTYLQPVIEPILDANSTTALYLFASPSQIDTVEVTFLQGQESPVTDTWMDHRTKSQVTNILQTFGVKAMNHRGIQKHAGA